MNIARTINQARASRQFLGTMALVPTMGALHEGHLSLIKIAKEHAPSVTVSIFVNPTQFGPREDFAKYPRPIEADLEMCEKAGVDLVFNPSVEEMYPNMRFAALMAQGEAPPPLPSPGVPEEGEKEEAARGEATEEFGAIDFGTIPIEEPIAPRPPGERDEFGSGMPERAPGDLGIDIPSLTTVLEGKNRPGHFKGVCQVVAKLFNILTPEFACFGEKDFQQLRVISAMVDVLNFPVRIVGCPTVREPDGLAMSSRNRYLSAADRKRALAISRGLFAAKKEVEKGQTQINRILSLLQRALVEQRLQSDYVAAIDPLTLKSVSSIKGPTVLAIAARVGNTRLIDNIIVEPAAQSA